MKKPIDFKVGYELAILNANNHIKVAELTSKEICYGIANSHLVLAAEEAIKAYMIFTRAYDPTFEIKDFDKFFENHKHKHHAISELSYQHVFWTKILEISTNPFYELLKKDDFSTDDVINAKDKGVDNLIEWLETIPEIDHDEQWWNEANNNKNRGFYINKNNNTWQSPNDITEQQYNESYKIVRSIVDIVNKLKSIETNPLTKIMTKKMKEIRDKNSSI